MTGDLSEARLLAQQNSSSNNSTCYWSSDKIADKDAATFPFFLYFLIAFGAIKFIKMVVDLKQLRKYKETRRDPYVAELFNEQEFEDSQKYNAEKMEFSILHKLFDTAFEVLLWVFFWYVAIWNWMDSLMSNFAMCADQPYVNDIIQAYMFSVFLSLLDSLLNLPFSIYHTFVIEEKYGFNKMTPGTFVCDELKKFVLVLILYAIIIPLILWIIHVSGPALVLTLAACSIGLVILLSLLVPTVIVPLFFTYTDLEEGELRTAVLHEAEKTDVNVAEVKVIDGSKRSSHSNAFVSGFWSFRKVVLFDTLIAQHPVDEVCAVVNHELGHVAHKHVIQQVFLSSMSLIVMFLCFSFTLGNKGIIESFGFENVSNFLYLFLFMQLYKPVSFVVDFISMYFIRRAEYQADAFAVKHNHGKALKTALVNLFKRNKGPLVADPLYSAMNHSHPTLVERLHAIDEAIKNQE